MTQALPLDAFRLAQGRDGAIDRKRPARRAAESRLGSTRPIDRTEGHAAQASAPTFDPHQVVHQLREVPAETLQKFVRGLMEVAELLVRSRATGHPATLGDRLRYDQHVQQVPRAKASFVDLPSDRRAAFSRAIMALLDTASPPQRVAFVNVLLGATSVMASPRLPTVGFADDEDAYLVWGGAGHFEITVDSDGNVGWFALDDHDVAHGSESAGPCLEAEAWEHLARLTSP